MKSQKISNRAPRPFKTKNDRWSGGGGQQNFIPSPKPVVRSVKTTAATKGATKPSAAPPAENAAAAGEVGPAV